MADLIIVGAGAMGLAAAHHAAKAGHRVTVLEAASEAGGMAAHFDLAGVSIERFYHFVCKSDHATFALLDELGLGDRMRWVGTSMGYFFNGSLHPWGDPVSLLRFPGLDPLSKIRYGLLMFLSTRRERWDALETQSAKDWITRWCGAKVYERLWRPLFDLKFYELADPISAAWIWTRIKRVGRSRRSLFQEELGYIEGGSQTLVDALVASVKAKGGTLKLAEPAVEIMAEDGTVTGVRTPLATYRADAVISTVPTPFVPALVPALPEDWKARYAAIDNIGVACLVFRLKRSVTRHFWVNVSDPAMPIPGIIEFSRLRPIGGDTVVYVPYYMPVTNPKFAWPDQQLLDEAFACLQRINPALERRDIVAAHVARLRYSQPICPPGFASRLPPIQTPIRGLQIADTCFYYPEDRGISEGARLAREMVSAL